MSLFNAAVSGINAALQKYNVSANNRANMLTTGFKKSRLNLATTPYDNGVKTVSIQKTFSPGTILPTNDPLDMAISGKGFFQITLKDNTTAYTRDGAFFLDKQGKIVNSDGNPLSPQVTIPSSATNLSIDRDGTIRGKVNGSIQEFGKVELANFANEAGLSSVGDNLLKETATSGAPMSGFAASGGFGEIVQGGLEMSNVDLAGEAVDEIITKAMLGANLGMIKKQDEMIDSFLDIFS